jgi:hypothetical protein
MIKVVNPYKFYYGRHQKKLLSLAKDYGISKKDSVAVNWDLAFTPQEISMRKEIYWFPMIPIPKEAISSAVVPKYKYPGLRDVDYLVIDLLLPNSDSDESWQQLQDILWRNKDYGVKGCNDGILVIKKGETGTLLDCVRFKEVKPSHAANITLDGIIELVGYDIDEEYVKRGSQIKVTYYWKALRDIDKKYGIVSIFKKPKVEEFSYFHKPVYGLYPTDRWVKGDIIKDEVFVKIPHDLKIVKSPFTIFVALANLSGEGGEKGFGDIFVLPDLY